MAKWANSGWIGGEGGLGIGGGGPIGICGQGGLVGTGPISSDNCIERVG